MPGNHDNRLKHIDLAEAVETGGNQPYYYTYCTCGNWRSRRFGHMINDTDARTKAAYDAIDAWRAHVSEVFAPPTLQPNLL